MTIDKEQTDTELDKQQYVGNSIPLVIKIFWGVFVVWLLWYLSKFMFPNLSVWLSK